MNETLMSKYLLEVENPPQLVYFLCLRGGVTCFDFQNNKTAKLRLEDRSSHAVVDSFVPDSRDLFPSSLRQFKRMRLRAQLWHQQ